SWRLHCPIFVHCSSYAHFFLTFPCQLLDLPSFPTRRSSDLYFRNLWGHHLHRRLGGLFLFTRICSAANSYPHGGPYCQCLYRPRSEEHTSELQSRFDLVCRLLLDKKTADTP